MADKSRYKKFDIFGTASDAYTNVVKRKIGDRKYIRKKLRKKLKKELDKEQEI